MINTDQYGIIGQIQSDGSIEGGDSACWQGHYLYLTKEKWLYRDAFEVGFGAYVRHPDPKNTNNGFGAYYKNPWSGCISRDQKTGIIAGLISQKDYIGLLRLILHHACRGFLFSYNTIKNGEKPETAKWKFPDITFMDIWATYLRGFGAFSWIFWPILCILDLHMLANTALVNKGKDDDVINYAFKLIVSRDLVPTPISKLSLTLCDKPGLLKKLKSYWCGRRDNCDMYDLFEKKLKELK